MELLLQYFLTYLQVPEAQEPMVTQRQGLLLLWLLHLRLQVLLPLLHAAEVQLQLTEQIFLPRPQLLSEVHLPPHLR